MLWTPRLILELMMKRNHWLSLVLVGMVSLVQAPAYADDDDDDGPKMAATAQALGLISLQDAQDKALAAKPGVVKEAELERRKFRSGWDYEFEIVDANGAEWEVNIDAKTGKSPASVATGFSLAACLRRVANAVRHAAPQGG